MINHSDDKEGRGVKHTPFFYQEFDYLNVSGPFNDGGCVARKNGKLQMECDRRAGTQGLPYRQQGNIYFYSEKLNICTNDEM